MVDFAQARAAMVEGQLRTSGVLDARLLHAMGEVPRETFVDEARRDIAYLDQKHKLDGTAERVLPSPVATAKLLELADICETDIVLDIACATGYSTAVIARLANGVVAIESDKTLVNQANQNLARLDVGNAAVIQAPLGKGAPGEAPFDVIVIEGAVGVVPPSLFAQLRDGGRLVAVFGTGASATAVLHVKRGESIARVRSFNASLPALPDFFPKRQFAL